MLQPLATDSNALPVAFVVLRASGHVGSRWLSELLATQNLTFLFEFPGRCSKAYPRMANASLQDIFRSGCACRLDSAMESVCASDEAGRIKSMGCVKSAFCGGLCPRRREKAACAAVGMVDSYQPALARRIAAAQPEFSPRSVVVTTFERDNAAKHAVSKLRASCGGTALKGNHVKAPMAGRSSNSSVTTTTSRMYIDPRLFLAEASQSLIGRRRMRDGVKQTLGQPRFELHYEDLQQSPSAAIGSMLRAIGVHRFDRAALGKSGLVKGSSDDLRRSILNFDELHEYLRTTPCLQEMLAARSPQRFDAACNPQGGEGGAHQAKQDTSVRVLSCAREGAACTVEGMNRLATNAVAEHARAAGLRARRSKRRFGTFTADSVKARPGLNASRPATRLTAAMRALVAGECTEAEQQLCARAFAGGSAASTDAEVCVLRAADNPLLL